MHVLSHIFESLPSTAFGGQEVAAFCGFTTNGRDKPLTRGGLAPAFPKKRIFFSESQDAHYMGRCACCHAAVCKIHQASAPCNTGIHASVPKVSLAEGERARFREPGPRSS